MYLIVSVHRGGFSCVLQTMFCTSQYRFIEEVSLVCYRPGSGSHSICAQRRFLLCVTDQVLYLIVSVHRGGFSCVLQTRFCTSQYRFIEEVSLVCYRPGSVSHSIGSQRRFLLCVTDQVLNLIVSVHRGGFSCVLQTRFCTSLYLFIEEVSLVCYRPGSVPHSIGAQRRFILCVTDQVLNLIVSVHRGGFSCVLQTRFCTSQYQVIEEVSLVCYRPGSVPHSIGAQRRFLSCVADQVLYLIVSVHKGGFSCVLHTRFCTSQYRFIEEVSLVCYIPGSVPHSIGSQRRFLLCVTDQVLNLIVSVHIGGLSCVLQTRLCTSQYRFIEEVSLVCYRPGSVSHSIGSQRRFLLCVTDQVLYLIVSVHRGGFSCVLQTMFCTSQYRFIEEVSLVCYRPGSVSHSIGSQRRFLLCVTDQVLNLIVSVHRGGFSCVLQTRFCTSLYRFIEEVSLVCYRPGSVPHGIGAQRRFILCVTDQVLNLIVSVHRGGFSCVLQTRFCTSQYQVIEEVSLVCYRPGSVPHSIGAQRRFLLCVADQVLYLIVSVHKGGFSCVLHTRF